MWGERKDVWVESKKVWGEAEKKIISRERS